MQNKTNFFSVQNRIFDQGVSANAKLVYMYLSKCADCFGKSWPAQKTIATSCSLGITAVKSALEELKQERIITVSARYRENGGKSSNMYMIMDRENKNRFFVNPIVFARNISSKAKLVYFYLCRCANREGICYPAHKTTAEKCAVAFSTARKAVRELINACIIKAEVRTRKDNGQTSNLYVLLNNVVENTKNVIKNGRKRVQELKESLEKTQDNNRKIIDNKEEKSILKDAFAWIKSKCSREHRQYRAGGLLPSDYERTIPRLRNIHNEGI